MIALAPLVTFFKPLFRHIAERRVLRCIARLPAHLQRDMGFDPALVAASERGDLAVGVPFRQRELEKMGQGESTLTAASPALSRSSDVSPMMHPECETTGVTCC